MKKNDDNIILLLWRYAVISSFSSFATVGATAAAHDAAYSMEDGSWIKRNATLTSTNQLRGAGWRHAHNHHNNIPQPAATEGAGSVLCRLYLMDTIYHHYDDSYENDPFLRDETSSSSGKQQQHQEQHYACGLIVNGKERNDDLFPLPSDFSPAMVMPPTTAENQRGHDRPMEHLKIFNLHELHHNDQWWVEISNAVVTEELNLIVSNESEYQLVDRRQRQRYLHLDRVLSEEEEEEEDESNQPEQHWTMGDRTISIVRISTLDAEPEYSLVQLIMGMFVVDVSVRNQFLACSFNKMRWKLESAHDVTVPASVSEFASNPGYLIQQAQRQLEAQLGIDSVAQMADRIVMCVPPGTETPGQPPWVARAGVGHWRAQFNNEWCLSLSALMHELGHTMHLLHSREGSNPYGDGTDYMSASHNATQWPRKCFNGHNNALLQWYQDRTLTISIKKEQQQIDTTAATTSVPTTSTTITTGTAQRIELIAFVDYAKTDPSQVVLIHLDNTYFLQYNRARDMNADTEEKGDLLTITQADPNDGGSEGLAGLDVGERWIVRDYYDDSRDLWIEVCQRRRLNRHRRSPSDDGDNDEQADDSDDNENTLELLVVSIGLEETACNQSGDSTGSANDDSDDKKGGTSRTPPSPPPMTTIVTMPPSPEQQQDDDETSTTTPPLEGGLGRWFNEGSDDDDDDADNMGSIQQVVLRKKIPAAERKSRRERLSAEG